MRTSLTRRVLQELHGAALADPRAAALLADDGLRLLLTAPEDFGLIRQAGWYRRLWSALGGAPLQAIAARCAQLEHAQDLLVEVLRALARDHPGALAPVELLVEDLARRAARHGGLTGHLRTCADSLVDLRDRLRRESAAVVDERALPEPQRELLLRAMIAAAWADGAVQEEERQLIAFKLDALAVSPAARRRVEADLAAPTPLEPDLGAVASAEVRHVLYRNVAAVVMADGEIQTRETLFLSRLARALGLAREVSAAIDEELYRLRSVRGLEELVASVLPTGGALGAPPDAAAPPPAAAGAVDQTDELGERWLGLLVRLAGAGCAAFQAPLQTRLRALSAADRLPGGLPLLDEAVIGAECREQANELFDHLDRILDGVLVVVAPRLREAGRPGWSGGPGRRLRGAADAELSARLAALGPVTELAVRLRAGAPPLAPVAEPLGVALGAAPAEVAGEAPGRAGDGAEAVRRVQAEYAAALPAALAGLDAGVGQIYELIVGAARTYFDETLAPLLAGADAATQAAFRAALDAAQAGAGTRRAATGA